MVTVVGEIAILVGADVAPLITNLGKGQAAVSRFGAQAQASATGGMKAFSAAGLLIGGAVAAASIGIVKLTKDAVEQAGALHDASLQTGIHVAQLQAMVQVAGEASVAQDELLGGITRMEKSIAGLSDGTKAQVDAFRGLGLTMADLAGQDPSAQFELIATRIEAIKDPTERTAAAMAVFGKSGAGLIPMMTGYSAALADVAQHQRDTGQAMSDLDAANLDNVGDTIGRIKDSAKGLGTQLAISFGPALLAELEGISALFHDLADDFQSISAAITTTDAEQKIKDIAAATKTMTDMADGAVASIGLLAHDFQGVSDGAISAGLDEQQKKLAEITETFATGGMSASDYQLAVTNVLAKVEALLLTVQSLDKDTDLSAAIDQFTTFGGKIDASATALFNLKGPLDAAADAGRGAAAEAEKAAVSFESLGDSKIADAIRVQETSLTKAAQAMSLGALSADEYRKRTTDAVTEIKRLIGQAHDLNAADMSDAVKAMDGYSTAISTALGWLTSLRGEQIKVAASAAPGGDTAPVLKPDGVDGASSGVSAGVTVPANITIHPVHSGGGGGGSGNSTADDLKALQDSLASQAALEMQAYNAGQKTLEDALAKKLITNEQYQTDLEALQKDHAGKMVQINADAYSSLQGPDGLKALQDSLAQQADLENTAYADAQTALEDALAQKLLTQQQYQADLEALQQGHTDRMRQIDAASYGAGLAQTGDYFGVLADTFQSGNDKLQKIGRVFGAAEALVNSWRAYVQTLADPTLPFFAKFAAAASVLGAGLAAVSAIKGGGSGGGSSGGGSASASAPTPQQAPLQVSMSLFGTGDFVSKADLGSLLDMLNKEAGDRGYTILGPA